MANYEQLFNLNLDLALPGQIFQLKEGNTKGNLGSL